MRYNAHAIREPLCGTRVASRPRRVIKQNGELNAIFPGGVEAQAVRLRQEGFTIDTNGKVPKVKQFKASLVRFD